jgi:hypothetical protein
MNYLSPEMADCGNVVWMETPRKSKAPKSPRSGGGKRTRLLPQKSPNHGNEPPTAGASAPAVDPIEAIRLMRALMRIGRRDLRGTLISIAESYISDSSKSSPPSATRVPFPKSTDVAQRLKEIRAFMGYPVAKEFAESVLNIGNTVWNTYETGQTLIVLPAAVKLISVCPGLTLDWIYFGRAEGLTRDLWIAFGPKDFLD